MIIPQPVLLTGATGFIGFHLLDRLCHSEAKVYAVARSVPNPCQPTRATFIPCDLASPADVQSLRAVRAPLVVHLAARMPQAMIHQETMDENIVANVLATVNLVNNLRGVSYFVYISSVDVYGHPAYLPVDEKHPTQPETYYGAAKLSSEHLLRVHCRQAGIALLILRLTQIYGPGEPVIKLIPRAIAAVTAGQPPTILGDGTDSRDYLHVADAVEVIVRSLQSRPTGVLNVATGTSRTVAEVVETILRVSGVPLAPVHQPQAKERLRFAFDVTELRRQLGEIEFREFADGVREQYEHHLRLGRNDPGCSPPVLHDLPGPVAGTEPARVIG